ncbi:unnamed protein product [Sphenostylis stenocarpa]|uniref:Uncharacterized protein n=1 Tax=Sphenostylis stenocarpa TaxID=92480 RepID=A0AA86VFA2_9FABA|nr:unnamed protein product [Sphenostylis stenocarpa]
MADMNPPSAYPKIPLTSTIVTIPPLVTQPQASPTLTMSSSLLLHNKESPFNWVDHVLQGQLVEHANVLSAKAK